MPSDCQHKKVLIVTRYYPGTRYEPPETVVLFCQCKECEEPIDWGDQSGDADIEEIDYRDYY